MDERHALERAASPAPATVEELSAEERAALRAWRAGRLGPASPPSAGPSPLGLAAAAVLLLLALGLAVWMLSDLGTPPRDRVVKEDKAKQEEEKSKQDKEKQDKAYYAIQSGTDLLFEVPAELVKEVKKADVQVAYTRIVAPFDGVVVRRQVDTGHLTRIGTDGPALFTVARSEGRWPARKAA